MFTLFTLAVTFAPAFPGDPKPARDPESVFKRLDLNGDGKISRDEFAKLREGLSEKAKAATRHGELLTDKVFDLMDENKDGYVTLDEFKKFRDRTAAFLKKRKTGDAS